MFPIHAATAGVAGERAEDPSGRGAVQVEADRVVGLTTVVDRAKGAPILKAGNRIACLPQKRIPITGNVSLVACCTLIHLPVGPIFFFAEASAENHTFDAYPAFIRNGKTTAEKEALPA